MHYNIKIMNKNKIIRNYNYKLIKIHKIIIN